jgi:lipoyl(octanoyl) transferase
MNCIARNLGLVRFEDAWRRMRRFVDLRDADTPDELWFLQHPAVFTLGQGGRREHVNDVGSIPLVQTDRGGQVTYHGPGQLVVYVLADLRRIGIGPRELVRRLEESVIRLLAAIGIAGERRVGAPGVYVNDAKIAALGLRIRKGCSYHGLALNVEVDLAPFLRIDPCGYRGLRVTRLRDEGFSGDCDEVRSRLLPHLFSVLENG